MQWQVKWHNRHFMSNVTATANFNNLQELIEFLKNYIPDQYGWIGEFVESDIIEIIPC